MKIKNISFILLAFLLLACGSPNVKIKTFGNLEIHYKDDYQLEQVNALGDFFQTNGLIHPTAKHSIRLTSDSLGYILNLILNPELETIPEDKLKEIIYLERALDTTVFKDFPDHRFRIEITDAYFNPLIQ